MAFSDNQCPGSFTVARVVEGRKGRCPSCNRLIGFRVPRTHVLNSHTPNEPKHKPEVMTDGNC